MEKQKSKKAADGHKSASEPWDKANPKKRGEHETLTPQAKAAAKKRAKAAGRPYPNLVDNMQASVRSKK